MAEVHTLDRNFAGARVIAFESRLSDVMRNSLEKHGAHALVAPSMKEIPLENHPEIFAVAEKLFADQIHLLICLTGVGTQILIDLLNKYHGREKTIEALSRLTIVARGPKPVKVLKEAGIPISIIVPEPNTWHEILEELDWNKNGVDLQGKTVAVQEYGISNPALIEGLKKRGANIVQVPVYRWGLPENTAPLETAIHEILEGKASILLFTSAHQVRNLLRFASEKGVEKALREAMRRSVICSVGPTCSEAIQESGLPVDFMPSHPKMGHLVSETAKNAAQLLAEKKNLETPTVGLRFREMTSSEREQRKKESVFLKACRRESVPYTPIWLMRQAGRYLKEYRRIRDRVPFIELCKNKDLCAEITITAAEKLKVDAAILFSDLLLIVEPLGMELHYARSEGPVITGSLDSPADIDALKEVNPEQSLSYVLDAVRLTRSSMNILMPLIGFGPAPFTLASYMIEGGGSRHFAKTKAFMYRDPGAWHALLDKLDRAILTYLAAQIRAGVDAIQIFDSWVGCLGPQDYRDYVLPHTKKIIAGLGTEVPVIHFGTGTGAFLKDFRDAGAGVIGLDYRMELGEAWKIVGQHYAVQGNLDPAVLYAPVSEICRQAKQILTQARGRPGHIFNLGHGVLPQTPEDHVLALVDFVHEMSQQKKFSKK